MNSARSRTVESVAIIECTEKSTKLVSHLQSDTSSKKLYPPTAAVDPQLDDEFLIDSKLIMSELKESWGVLLDDFNIAPDTADADAPLSRSRLENVPEAILMSESWNKVLAFRSMFSESIVGRWRVLAAADEIQRHEEAKFKSRFWTKSVLSSVKSSKNTVENFQYRSTLLHPLYTYWANEIAAFLPRAPQ